MSEEGPAASAPTSGWRKRWDQFLWDFVQHSQWDDRLDKFMKKMERPMKMLFICEVVLIVALFFLGLSAINWLKDTREEAQRLADPQTWDSNTSWADYHYLAAPTLHPEPGEIVDAPGKSCSLLFGMGRPLATKTELDVSFELELAHFEAGVGGTIISIGETDDFECPGKAGDSAVCKIGREYETSSYYRLDWLVTGLVLFTILKPIGSKVDIMDLVLSLLFCCCIPTEKRTYAWATVRGWCRQDTSMSKPPFGSYHTRQLMLQFSWLDRLKLKKTRKVLIELAVYLRFKMAPNIMMLPLTTLAFNSRCPQHLYLSLPGSSIPHTVIGMGAFDIFWLTIGFLVASKKPKWVESKWFVIFYLQGYMLLGFLLVTLILSLSMNLHIAWFIGFNFGLAVEFNLQLALDVFQLLAAIVTVIDVVLLVLHSLEKLDAEFDEANAKVDADARAVGL